MKVGILTFHRADNYGAMLQAYALMTELNHLGCDTEIIDYRNKYIEAPYYPYSFLPKKAKNLLKWGYHFFENIWLVPKENKNGIKCNEFRNKYFKMSRSVSSTDDRAKIENEYDLVITGSDQIWNPKITHGKDDWYCFKRKNGKTVIAAYATSVGDLTEFRKHYIDYADDIKKYDFISVREDDLKDFLTNEYGVPTIKVLDPTLIVNRSIWNNIAYPVRSDRYVFCYDVDTNETSNQIATEIAKKENIKLVHFNKKKFYDKNLLIDAGPDEFVGLIKNAEYVVTSSFHGTVFSILFKKKFISVIHPSTSSRAVTLLKELNLEDRICTTVDDFHGFSDDFHDSDERLEKLRKESIDYLKEVIANVQK